MANLDKTAKSKAFDFFYSNPILRYLQNWGHIVTEQFLPGQGLILDLGAGTGEHYHFAKPGCHYVALDMDVDVLRISREQGRNRQCVQALAQQLPFKDGSFDGVLTVYNLEHLADLDGCIAEMARVLKPGGVLAAAVPTEGMLFRLGRRLVTAPFAVKNLGFRSVQEYEEWMATQHINLPEKIVALLERQFQLVEKRWFPFFVGSKTINVSVGIKAIPNLHNRR